MTVHEFFKTKTIDELAEAFADHMTNKGGIPLSDPFVAFDIQDYFNFEQTCPEECEYLSYDWKYEEAWMNGCQLRYWPGLDLSKCPRHIDKKEAYKSLFAEWLNSEI